MYTEELGGFMVHKYALTTKDAARYLGISESVLRQSRMNGPRSGHIPTPPYVRVGTKILYLPEDLKQWLVAHRVDPISRATKNSKKVCA